MKLSLLGVLLAWLQAVAALEVTDTTGHRVALTHPAQRVVTLAPHATELVLALQAGHRLVGVADFFDNPPGLTRVPRLATVGGLDRERLLQLQPDLVIGWASGNRPGDLRWLEEIGIPVYLSEPGRLDDIGVDLEGIGHLLGLDEQAKAVARHFRQRLARACDRRRDAPWLRAWVRIWPDPPMTIGRRHWLNEVLERAHLHNIFADLPRAVVSISPEALLARPHRLTLATDPLAVAEPGSRLVPMDPTLGRPGPRVVEGLKRLCDELENL